MQVRAVGRVARLGPEWDAVFSAGPGVQSRRWWFEATAAAAMPAGAVAEIVVVEAAGRPVAVLPMMRRGRRFGSLTSPYTTLFQPLLAPGEDAAAVGAALGGYLRRWAVVRLDALDPAWPGLEPLLAGLRGAGLVVQRYRHFGNWSEEVRGLDWPQYLAARPGALREVIRRRGRAIEKLNGREGAVVFEVVRGGVGQGGARQGGVGLGRAMAAYEEVYARSWKVPEPFPRFNQVMLPVAAGAGVLLLAVMWRVWERGAEPVAAQYWTVEHGVATVLKLAHDDAAKALSPGTMLTAHVVRLLLDEGVSTLDFGRGDDGYKQAWCTVRQQRMGVLLVNAWRLGGLVALGRQAAGRVARMVLRR